MEGASAARRPKRRRPFVWTRPTSWRHPYSSLVSPPIDQLITPDRALERSSSDSGGAGGAVVPVRDRSSREDNQYGARAGAGGHLTTKTMWTTEAAAGGRRVRQTTAPAEALVEVQLLLPSRRITRCSSWSPAAPLRRGRKRRIIPTAPPTEICGRKRAHKKHVGGNEKIIGVVSPMIEMNEKRTTLIPVS